MVRVQRIDEGSKDPVRKVLYVYVLFRVYFKCTKTKVQGDKG